MFEITRDVKVAMQEKGLNLAGQYYNVYGHACTWKVFALLIHELLVKVSSYTVLNKKN